MELRLQLYYLLLLIVGIVGVVRFKKLTTPFKILVVIILITTLSEAVSRYLAKTIRNSNPPYHFFVWIEYAGFTGIYLYYFFPEKLRRALKLMIPAFVIFCSLNTIFFQHLFTFPSNILLVEHTLLILFSLMLFRQMIYYPIQVNVLKQDIFWFNTIVLIYYASDFLIWAFHNYFLRHKINADFIYTFNYAINMLFYFVLGIIILLNRQNQFAINGKR